MISVLTKVALKTERAGKWMHGHLPSVATAVVLATSLSNCGSVSDQSVAGTFSSPGKYDIYTCEDVERYLVAFQTRKVELEQLMSRSSQGAGGEFVNIIAYRGEYELARDDLAALTKAKAEKQCAVNNKFSSGRAVF
jgi:hypothetical protein